MFLMRDRKRMDSDGMGVGEALEELEGGETIIRMYYVRKKSIFNQIKKKDPVCWDCIYGSIVKRTYCSCTTLDFTPPAPTLCIIQLPVISDQRGFDAPPHDLCMHVV